MFLHSGASLHGHEFSLKPASAEAQAGARRSPLLFSPFRPSPTRASTAPISSDPPQLRSCLPQQRPELRRRSPTIEEPVVRFHEPLVVEEIKLDPASATVTVASSVTEADGSCSEAEGSESGRTVAVPVAKSAGRRRQKQARRTNTFCIARPPPRLVKKRLMQQIRPKLLLQLHQISADRRPTPVLDVFPAATIASPVVGGRLAVRFPRVFGVGNKGSTLGSQDVILFRSEEYYSTSTCGSTTDVPTDDGSLSRRDLVAVLSPLRREDRTEIVLSDGRVWTARRLPNGSFEFQHTDDDGSTKTARWVKRGGSGTMSPSTVSVREFGGTDLSSPISISSCGTFGPPDYKYTFSVIDPTMRRHPIVASLTRDALNINETYTAISAKTASAEKDEDSGDETETEEPAPKSERHTLSVDESLRSLISITALWVTLCLDGVMPSSTDATRANGQSRSRSGSLNSQQASPLGSPNRRQTISCAPASSDSCQPVTLPQRATSTGAAYMQRRIQMSDASDSDRSASRSNSKGRRVLRGPFACRQASFSQPSTTPGGDGSPSTRPSSRDGKAADPASPPTLVAKHKRSASGEVMPTAPREPHQGRRVQSAFYASTPLHVPEREDDHYDADLAGLALQATRPEAHEEAAEQNALARKWKKFGQWIRRFGR
ncbi:hypothetical protein PpBr36_08515 [Pyricularia pennisetigena]|uniref:hypothetical protein n=1 Tax=Pyricularia pennisetigena TaxID=1578925 RepID=UPI001152DFF0|nr:hypothetical protein PpBr36_08515 [Pyricularia pennisetigena]TLS24091.1 hypothetical protein PpBr36_08515 [Pyricularia pennisetigena]